MTDTMPGGLFADLDEQTAALHAALATAQAAFPPIPRDRTVRVKTRAGDTYEFSYAPLETVLEKVRPALGANGLAVTQTFRDGNLVTSLLHAGGGRIESVLPLQQDGRGHQEFGSAITYTRRYALVALLGVASEEDDDGNSAEGNIAQQKPRRTKASDKQIALINSLLRDLAAAGESSVDELKQFLHAEYGVEHTAELTGGKTGTASEVITRLQQRLTDLNEDVPWPDADPSAYPPAEQ